MDHKRRIPHEGVRNNEDGLPDQVRLTDDTEGHKIFQAVPEDLTVNPGTGGDFSPHKPSTGGELIDENDVEGHKIFQAIPEDLTVNPGTGGDYMQRRPSTGGEFIDENDVEGR